jgi:hypothetical protein
MSYIIVWRDGHRDPHIDIDSHGFRELYSSYESAKESAEEIIRTENQNELSIWYFDYKIYMECTS